MLPNCRFEGGKMKDDNEYYENVIEAYMMALRTIGTISGSELPDFKDMGDDDLSKMKWILFQDILNKLD